MQILSLFTWTEFGIRRIEDHEQTEHLLHMCGHLQLTLLTTLDVDLHEKTNYLH